MTKLSVITSPFKKNIKVFSSPRFLLKSVLKILFQPFRKKRDLTENFGGHPAVTRSYIEGFSVIGVSFNVNPKIENVNPYCIVLSDVGALKEAISLKRQGKVKKLFAGPNVVTIPSDFNRIICDDAIDFCIVPSEWVKKLYVKKEPTLSSKIIVLPAGVNLNQWPANNAYSTNRKVLLYLKFFTDDSFLESIENYFLGRGWLTLKIIYGDYSYNEYVSLLGQVSLVVFLGITESQGIAIAEAWASNLPTFVLRRDFVKLHDHQTYRASSAPYLSDSTGKFFSSIVELNDHVEQLEKGLFNYFPRAWVLQNMTDEVCAKLLLTFIEDS